jgi:hypothetical protein
VVKLLVVVVEKNCLVGGVGYGDSQVNMTRFEERYMFTPIITISLAKLVHLMGTTPRFRRDN